MIRKLLILLLIYIITLLFPQDIGGICFRDIFSQKVYAQEALKINSINFDNSDAIIFLGMAGTEETSDIKITKKVLTNPNRIFFDIENAVLTFPNKQFELQNSRITKLRIAQNSTEPNVVRIVIWNSSNYDSNQIKVLKIKNNIIIKLGSDSLIQQYMTQIYKETKVSESEYYDKTVVIPDQQNTPVKPIESDEIFNKVQKAFKEDNQEIVRPNIEQKQARLKSRFFLEKAIIKNGNILLSGIGVINVEKPFILKEPSRIIFDLPNTVVLQELRDKEISISEHETVKIGQFEHSKARIVIKTPNPELYKPIYSTNLQTLLIANTNRLSGVNLAGSLCELTYFKEQNVNTNTDVINIIFSAPVIYSIDRTVNKINITVYNLANFNMTSFNAIAQSKKNGIRAEQLGADTYKLSFPVNNSSFIDCYEALNASQLRLVFTKTEQENISGNLNSKIKPEVNKEESPFANLLERPLTKKQPKRHTREGQIPRKIRNKIIIIDPGHGGNDTGALRNNILEKNLTLDIAQKVRKELQKRGYSNVIMTRSSDSTLALADRVRIANDYHADIFVSIHINSSVKNEIHGIETHYYSESGYNVAKIIHKKLMSNVEANDRGLFKSKFYVINHTEAPAVLLELGFISNERERNLLNSEKRQFDSAKAIADGITEYFMEQ